MRRPAPRAPLTPEPNETPDEVLPKQDESRRRSNLTSRAVALAVVLLVLTISYATSLRIYFAQTADIAATRAEIAQRESRIAELQTDLTRWQDPAYVQTQARLRLGWVLPGETGFKVVGENGQPLGGGAEISSPQSSTTRSDAWWAKVWGSVEAADHPAPAPSRAATQRPITENTKPSPSASPR